MVSLFADKIGMLGHWIETGNKLVKVTVECVQFSVCWSHWTWNSCKEFDSNWVFFKELSKVVDCSPVFYLFDWEWLLMPRVKLHKFEVFWYCFLVQSTVWNGWWWYLNCFLGWLLTLAMWMNFWVSIRQSVWSKGMGLNMHYIGWEVAKSSSFVGRSFDVVEIAKELIGTVSWTGRCREKFKLYMTCVCVLKVVKRLNAPVWRL